MEMLTLKNGAEEPKPLVLSVTMSLQKIFEDNPIVAYELVTMCREAGHKFFGDSEEVLKAWGLVQPDGKVHESIRNIVLSAVQGDGLNMVLGSPTL